jgi:hypothetical protein
MVYRQMVNFLNIKKKITKQIEYGNTTCKRL